MAEPNPDELSASLRNAMMVFVAKFLVTILPPLIVVFFYILTITKDDIEIAAKNEITKIERTHQSNIAHLTALQEKMEQVQQNKITKMEQVQQNKIAEMEQVQRRNTAQTKTLYNEMKQIHQKNVAEMGLLHKKIKTCKKDCDKQNLELKISERTNISERFKMNFNVDKKRVEFKFEEVK